MSYLKKVYDMVKLFVIQILSSTRGRLEYIWYQIRTGQEPIIVRGIVVLIVAVAAMFGQIIDPNVVLTIIIFLVPAAISARGQVSPSETKFSWIQRVKDLFLKAPLSKGYSDGPVDPNAIEPDWAKEYEELEDDFDEMYEKYLEQAGQTVDDVREQVEETVDDVEEQVEDIREEVEEVIGDTEDHVDHLVQETEETVEEWSAEWRGEKT